jgi:Fe2+ transport system protein B
MPSTSCFPSSPSCAQASFRRIVAIGFESVGKTQLLGALTGRIAIPENFRGSTLACDAYRDDARVWVDTPGIFRESETATTRAALDALSAADQVMLVVRAGNALEELRSLLPQVVGCCGLVVLTFADRLPEGTKVTEGRLTLSGALGVPVFALNARHPEPAVLEAIRRTVDEREGSAFGEVGSLPEPFPPVVHAPSLLERAVAQPLVSLGLLLLPAGVSVGLANQFADGFFGPLQALLRPLLDRIVTWPSLPAALFGGDYGLVAMFPFLLLYAVPSIVAFSALLAIYKSSGLIDRISVALHPWLRPFGIGGRDLVRVVMGFGCNVPAVIATRACGSCSRGACVSAISFGSACSYQLPATLAVFAAAGRSGLSVVYVVVLAVSTLIYLRYTTPAVLRQSANRLKLPECDPLQAPSWRGVWREAAGTLQQFVMLALPVFGLICLAAAALSWLGVLDGLTRLLTPVMALFRLPGEAATAVVLGSIRKDGLAIGLLDSDWNSLKVALESPAQVLTAVYLAGVLLPCLVTLFTIAREMRWTFALKLCARQAAWAAGFSLVIAWVGAWFR